MNGKVEVRVGCNMDKEKEEKFPKGVNHKRAQM